MIVHTPFTKSNGLHEPIHWPSLGTAFWFLAWFLG